jgi:hypothetical protein
MAMMRWLAKSRCLLGLIALPIIMTGAVACAEKEDYMHKVSGVLLQQVDLRKEQMASPSEERLTQMKDMGLIMHDLNVQLVFIYVNGAFSLQEEKELVDMGVKVHADSWIPPVGSHPYGFYIAEMPVEKLEVLAAKDYIIKLDTAERQSLPQCPVNTY